LGSLNNQKGPDLDLTLSIENTDMRRMNDRLRAYGNFDVVAGNFSMYSKIKIRQGKIDGHVKPLFSDMKVYDSASGGREKHVSTALQGAGAQH